jgi:hypothetical protein
MAPQESAAAATAGFEGRAGRIGAGDRLVEERMAGIVGELPPGRRAEAGSEDRRIEARQ